MARGLVVTLSCLLLVAALPLAADDWDRQTTVTFDQPVKVPGRVLLPGTYVFKLSNVSSDRHLVTIYNEDGTHLYTTIQAINSYRVDAMSNAVFKFTEERAKGTPQALRMWFTPGEASKAGYLVLGSLISVIGAWFAMFRKSERRY